MAAEATLVSGARARGLDPRVAALLDRMVSPLCGFDKSMAFSARRPHAPDRGGHSAVRRASPPARPRAASLVPHWGLWLARRGGDDARPGRNARALLAHGDLGLPRGSDAVRSVARDRSIGRILRPGGFSAVHRRSVRA